MAVVTIDEPSQNLPPRARLSMGALGTRAAGRMAKATHTLRGVTYAAIVHSPDHVEIRAGSARVGEATLRVRLDGAPLLGGDATSGEAILDALERALGEALAEPARAAPAGDKPWQVMPQAVRDLLRITGRRIVDAGPTYEAALEELIAIARAVVASGKPGRPMGDGQVQYRGGRPLRLRLVTRETADGETVTLEAVRPDHEGRVGAYSQSAPERKRGGRPKQRRSE